MLPFEINEVTPEEELKIKIMYTGYEKKWIKLGPLNYVMPGEFRNVAEKIYNMDVRDDDTWVVTFPRSGTTLTQEMTWLLCNQLDFTTANSKPLFLRFPFMELKEISPEKSDMFDGDDFHRMIAEMPSPRFIKTHLPFSLLPPALFTRNAKVIYVARNPKDVVMSYYFLQLMYGQNNFQGDFKTFWNLFWNDLVIYSQPIAHVLEAWKMREHPNLMFLFYEDMRKDLMGVLKKAAEFFNQNYSHEQLQSLADHLNINNMRNNKCINISLDEKMQESSFHPLSPPDNQFIRKGEVGGWRKSFDDEQIKQADQYIKKHLDGTGFKYPE